MKNNPICGKKASIFELMIVLALFITCGYALFVFLTSSGGFEGILISPSSVLKLYSNAEKFEFFAEESMKLAIVQEYSNLAKGDGFTGDECLELKGYMDSCEISPELDSIYASKIKDNFEEFQIKYADDEFGNKFSEIIYEFEVQGDSVKVSSAETDLHMPVQEGNFPYSARYRFKQDISFSLDELGLTDLSEIMSIFDSCKSKSTVEEAETCMQVLENFDITVSKPENKFLFSIATKKKFFVESGGEIAYMPVEIKLSS